MIGRPLRSNVPASRLFEGAIPKAVVHIPALAANDAYGRVDLASAGDAARARMPKPRSFASTFSKRSGEGSPLSFRLTAMTGGSVLGTPYGDDAWAQYGAVKKSAESIETC